MLKNPTEYERDISSAIFTVISRQLSPALLLDICAGYCHRSLIDKSGMFRTYMGKHNREENGRSALDALCDTTP
jgi:hypothetical protein